MTLPNQLTVLRIILSPVFLFFFLSDHDWMKQVSLGIYIIAALSDWYDGWLARKFNYITNWGKFWDPLADKILTSIAFIGFSIVKLVPLWMVIIIISRDLLITLLRIFSDKFGLVFVTSYYAKWKTLIQMIFLYYLLIVFIAANTPDIYRNYGTLIDSMLNKDLIFIVMLIITAITFHSGVLYIYRNKITIKKLLKLEN
jgi:CDP-diacylglycerol---glycerol-3-phosphate 3-phosphatidyltransferase